MRLHRRDDFAERAFSDCRADAIRPLHSRQNREIRGQPLLRSVCREQGLGQQFLRLESHRMVGSEVSH